MSVPSTQSSHSFMKTSLLMDCVLFTDDKPLEQILIVDDEEAVRNLFSFCLGNRYVCTEAASVAEALERLAETEFELIISDLMMPELTGVDLLERVAIVSPDTLVIMASGVGDPQSALEAVRRGAFDYLIKPCAMDDLELTVERALENRRLKLEARQYKIDLENRNRQLAQGKAELERLQTQLFHHAKIATLEQFAANIAQELDGPVSFVQKNFDVLRREIASVQQLLDYYDAAEMSETSRAGAEAIKRKINYEELLKNLSGLSADCGDGIERVAGIGQNMQNFARLYKADSAETDGHEKLDSTARLPADDNADA